MRNERTERNRGESRKQKLLICSFEPRRMKALAIVEAEGCWVVSQKVYKTVDDDIAGVSGWVIEIAFHNNVFMSLNFSSTRAADLRLGK